MTGKSGLRYKTLSPDKEIIHHKDILYNFDNIPGEACVLVEGIFDVWRLGAGAVCPFGTTVTEKQKRLLMGLKRVFILFDPEEHTQAKARKLAIELADVGVVVETLTLADGDPADMSKADAEELMKDLRL
jgi:DNA primase